LPATLGVLLLLALLMWLLLRGTAYAVTLRAFDEFRACRGLSPPRCPARCAPAPFLLRDYDTLVLEDAVTGFVPTRRPRASTRDRPTTEAGISEVLRRPLASTELGAVLARCLRSPDTLQP
jgi:hypothetical protein